ncbi:hypothetical protein fugu_012209 [Takifugu bimaculatus]|uniref:Plasmolipin n=1 Tax=Takifugu bimaculatus TaxID=433685 RepID=A0A4Z2C9S3_9TELE|nr:hypothetical protein fugu_012209 [Takifugu bimaculatus]
MADFPSKVSTETSSPHSQGGNSFRGVTGMMDMSFLRSIVAILMIIEIVLGMIHWALIASTPYVHAAAYGWVMFVAVTLWLLTIGLFVIRPLQHQQDDLRPLGLGDDDV